MTTTAIADENPTGPVLPPPPRLSPLRVLVALILAVALVAGTWYLVTAGLATAPTHREAWFAPYVDVTATPRFAFEDAAATPAKGFVLGFIVADHVTPCTPSWGGYHRLDEAAAALDLDRRIARLRQRGGDVLASFGGMAGDELAAACQDGPGLVDAYRAVVERYSLTTIDFDLEGPSLSNPDVVQRRVAAIKALQAERPKNRKLAVWLTLPATTDGLSPAGVAAVDATLQAGIDLAGVNVMTMNFGSGVADSEMAVAVEASLRSARRQLAGAYQRARLQVSSADLWAKIGATPMIGQNDTPSHHFTLDAAHSLASLIDSAGLGRVSFWSANRDAACGPNVDTLAPLDYCSGIDQQAGEFTKTFTRFRQPGGLPLSLTRSERAAPPVDDPAHSPYPIWRDDRPYPKGREVVWHGEVYEAKWWTQGDVPDAPVVNVWETPWNLIGPVLPGDRPTTPTTLPAGTYPDWNAQKVYQKGALVLRNGLPYKAKWWTQGDVPDADVADEWDSPWQALFARPGEESAAPSAVQLPSATPPTVPGPDTVVGSAVTAPATSVAGVATKPGIPRPKAVNLPAPAAAPCPVADVACAGAASSTITTVTVPVTVPSVGPGLGRTTGHR